MRDIPFNNAPAPDRRQPIPLGGAACSGYLFCAPPTSAAAVGEARRWAVYAWLTHSPSRARRTTWGAKDFRPLVLFAGRRGLAGCRRDRRARLATEQVESARFVPPLPFPSPPNGAEERGKFCVRFPPG